MSFTRGRSVCFMRDQSVLTRGRSVFFEKGPNCPIGAKVVGAETSNSDNSIFSSFIVIFHHNFVETIVVVLYYFIHPNLLPIEEQELRKKHTIP